MIKDNIQGKVILLEIEFENYSFELHLPSLQELLSCLKRHLKSERTGNHCILRRELSQQALAGG